MTATKRDVALDGTGLAVDHLRDKSATLGKLGDARAALATIGAGSSSVAVQFPEALDGRPAFAFLNTVDGTLTQLLTAAWDGSGQLTVTGNANATGAVTVSVLVLEVLD